MVWFVIFGHVLIAKVTANDAETAMVLAENYCRHCLKTYDNPQPPGHYKWLLSWRSQWTAEREQ